MKEKSALLQAAEGKLTQALQEIQRSESQRQDVLAKCNSSSEALSRKDSAMKETLSKLQEANTAAALTEATLRTEVGSLQNQLRKAEKSDKNTKEKLRQMEESLKKCTDKRKKAKAEVLKAKEAMLSMEFRNLRNSNSADAGGPAAMFTGIASVLAAVKPEPQVTPGFPTGLDANNVCIVCLTNYYI